MSVLTRTPVASMLDTKKPPLAPLVPQISVNVVVAWGKARSSSSVNVRSLTTPLTVTV